MVESMMRSDFPISFSALSLPLYPSQKSLQNLPTELLFMTFRELDIPTLLKLCNACKRFQRIGAEILSEKFKEPDVGLTLSFGQEYRHIANIPFKFSEFDRNSGNFIFKPSSNPMIPMRFIHSSVVRSPVLNKVSINLPNNVNVENNDVTPTTQSRENLLEGSLALNIKQNRRSSIRQVRYVHRMGHGTTHLRIPYTFTYSITDVPPEGMQNTRGGERWLTPISFECPPSFFYPREPIAYKIIMTIIHLRKRHKKRLSQIPKHPSSQVSNNKQKQNDINFEEVEEVDGFVSITVENDTNRKVRQPSERSLNQQEQLLPLKLKGRAKKFMRGARS